MRLRGERRYRTALAVADDPVAARDADDDVRRGRAVGRAKAEEIARRIDAALAEKMGALAKRFGAESAIGIEPWPPRPVAVMRIQNGAFSATPIP